MVVRQFANRVHAGPLSFENGLPTFDDGGVNNGITDGAQGEPGASRMERPMFFVRDDLYHQHATFLAHKFADYLNRLLIPLNVCRRDNLYVPWECENERHAYEE